MVFLAAVAITSFRNGTFRSLIEILMIFISIYISEKICQALIFQAGLFEASNALAYAVFFVLFFVIAYAILKVALWFVSKVIKIANLGIFDKALAALTGVLIALLFAGLFIDVALMVPLSPEAKNYIESSQTQRFATPVFNKMYDWAFQFAPEMDKLIGKNIDEKVNQFKAEKTIDNITQEAASKIEAAKETVINLKLPKLESSELPKLSIEKELK